MGDRHGNRMDDYYCLHFAGQTQRRQPNSLFRESSRDYLMACYKVHFESGKKAIDFQV